MEGEEKVISLCPRHFTGTTISTDSSIVTSSAPSSSSSSSSSPSPVNGTCRLILAHTTACTYTLEGISEDTKKLCPTTFNSPMGRVGSVGHMQLLGVSWRATKAWQMTTVLLSPWEMGL